MCSDRQSLSHCYSPKRVTPHFLYSSSVYVMTPNWLGADAGKSTAATLLAWTLSGWSSDAPKAALYDGPGSAVDAVSETMDSQAVAHHAVDDVKSTIIATDSSCLSHHHHFFHYTSGSTGADCGLSRRAVASDDATSPQSSQSVDCLVSTEKLGCCYWV